MEAAPLQLFDPETTQLLSSPISASLPIIQPQKPKPEFIYNPQKELEQSLDSILPTNQEENKLFRARNILGEVAKDETDEQLQTFITEMQYLLDSWLDVFEKQVFDGQTLKQLLRGG